MKRWVVGGRRRLGGGGMCFGGGMERKCMKMGEDTVKAKFVYRNRKVMFRLNKSGVVNALVLLALTICTNRKAFGVHRHPKRLSLTDPSITVPPLSLFSSH